MICKYIIFFSHMSYKMDRTSSLSFSLQTRKQDSENQIPYVMASQVRNPRSKPDSNAEAGASQSVASGPAASAASGNLFTHKFLGSITHLINWKLWGWVQQSMLEKVLYVTAKHTHSSLV